MLIHFAKSVIRRAPRPAHGADRVGLLAAVDGLAQAPDTHVDGVLVDINLTAPDAPSKVAKTQARRVRAAVYRELVVP